jgi:hypothetical protein
MQMLADVVANILVVQLVSGAVAPCSSVITRVAADTAMMVGDHSVSQHKLTGTYVGIV